MLGNAYIRFFDWLDALPQPLNWIVGLAIVLPVGFVVVVLPLMIVVRFMAGETWLLVVAALVIGYVLGKNAA